MITKLSEQEARDIEAAARVLDRHCALDILPSICSFTRNHGWLLTCCHMGIYIKPLGDI